MSLEGSGIFNGDMGVIISIDNTYDEFTVDYDGKIVTYTNENLDEIEHAYAITVHKSQGSEFKAIIMPIASPVYLSSTLLLSIIPLNMYSLPMSITRSFVREIGSCRL